MADFSNLISQAKKMQEKMKETQDALKKIEVVGVSGADAVKIIMNGDGELKKITFSENVLKESKEILEDLDLYSKANSYTRSLSGGMKRRLMIAKALVHNPSILVLDEPTAGVDVTLRQQLWKYIENLKSKGKTILLTTHYIEEAEKLCDRICIVNNGKIVLSETKKKIMNKFKRKKLEDIFINITKS